MPVAFASITADPLSLDAHIDAVTAASYGAVATFVGRVRDHDPSVTGEVARLEYSAHPDAESALRAVVAGLAHEAVTIAVTHRIGSLAVGDDAIVVAVASAHRAEAFEVCRDLVERIKAHVPIWKREVLVDGSHVWVGIT